jgi:hypothetical protein
MPDLFTRPFIPGLLKFVTGYADVSLTGLNVLHQQKPGADR